MKQLSIIVPVYNVQYYISQCLYSLVNQTYPNKEILLIDDGSTDKSGDICDKYSREYPFVKCIHQKNSGVSVARNNGIECSQGDYIAFVDSDDCIDLDMYEILIDNLERYGCDIAAGGYKKEYSDNFNCECKYKKEKTYLYSNKSEVIASLFSDDGTKSIQGYLWNKVYRKECVKNVRFDEKIKITEDLLFVWNVINKNANKVILVPYPFYHYRYNASSATNTGKVSDDMQAIGTWEKIIDEMRDKPIEKQCILCLKQNYLTWNLISLESMYNGSFNNRYYSLIRDNIIENSNYLQLLPKHNQILARAATKSWSAYKCIARPLFFCKSFLLK